MDEKHLWTPTIETWDRMFRATNQKREYAEKLINRMTTAEMRLWAELSQVNIGTKNRPCCEWRPQVVIKGWIVDFYSDQHLWVVEVDGSIHDEPEQKAKDAIKDGVLKHFGIQVKRYRNEEVWQNPEGLVRRIYGYE